MTWRHQITRRDFGASLGVLVATFSLGPMAADGQSVESAAPNSFAKNSRLEGWIRIASDGTVTVFTGKAKLGQGILTALAQIAAEELDVHFASVRIISADTTQGPDEGYTYGSQSIEQSGSAIRTASAQARAVLFAAAAARLKVDVGQLRAESGVIKARDGSQIGYGKIADSDRNLLKRNVNPLARAKNADQHKVVGTSVRRIDLPDKLMARPCYVQDMRLPGMVFGRVIRPPRAGATLLSFDEAAARALPGVVEVVRDVGCGTDN
jgi:nicotinate dehydrogenase subunit B